MRRRTPLLNLLALLSLTTLLACDQKAPSPSTKTDSTSDTAQSAGSADAGASAKDDTQKTLPDSDARGDAPAKVERSGREACTASIDETGQVSVEGTPTSLKLPPGSALRVHPYSTAEILVAVQPNPQMAGRALDGRLWKVGCAAPHSHALLFKLDKADFGNAATSRDGEQLYFSSPQGIGALALSTLKWTQVTNPPSLKEHCGAGQGVSGRAVDVVSAKRVSGNKLIFQRGGPCGEKGAWVTTEMHLTRPLEPAKRLLKVPQQVSTVAIGADGAIWIGDAGRCDQPGVLDPQTPGALWVSRDDGDAWTQRLIKVGKDAPQTAIRRIYADARGRGQLLAVSARCKVGDVTRGGTIYQTRNNGRTWTRLNMPEGIESDTDDQGVHALEVVNGDLKRLRLWSSPSARWETEDGGRTWTQAPPRPTPRVSDRVAQNDAWSFRATSSGLLRKDLKTRRLRRVYPPDSPR